PSAIMLSLSPLSCLLTRPPPPSTLFPYTTLFRSTFFRQQLQAALHLADGVAQSIGCELWLGDDRRVQMRHTFVVAKLQPFGIDQDRKSTRLNSSHVAISYAVFCLKKKKTKTHIIT